MITGRPATTDDLFILLGINDTLLVYSYKIYMSQINSLPSVNSKFSARSGLGSFKKKLTSGMHTAGELSAFKRHPKAAESLVDSVAKYQTRIRRGGLTQAQIKKIKATVVKSDPTVTINTKRLIGRTLAHLSRAQSQASMEKTEMPARNQTRPGQFIYNPARNNAPQHITSIANQTGKTAAFHQFGDTVSRTKGSDRSSQIYGSASAAAKDSHSANIKADDEHNTIITPTIPQDEIPK